MVHVGARDLVASGALVEKDMHGLSCFRRRRRRGRLDARARALIRLRRRQARALRDVFGRGGLVRLRAPRGAARVLRLEALRLFFLSTFFCWRRCPWAAAFFEGRGTPRRYVVLDEYLS